MAQICFHTADVAGTFEVLIKLVQGGGGCGGGGECEPEWDWANSITWVAPIGNA